MSKTVTKEFVRDILSKYPEVQKHASMFGLNLNVVKKVLYNNYSYSPEEKEKKYLVFSKEHVDIPRSTSRYDNLDSVLKELKEAIIDNLYNETGIKDISQFTNFEFSNQWSNGRIYYSYQRLETDAEYAHRMNTDAELKSLYEISEIIKKEYNGK